MTKTEKAIRDFCGHHADWWPSTTQVQEMLALAQPEPLFAVFVAARKWAALQEEGYKMQQISFARDGKTGNIDAWGKVLWQPVQPDQFKPDYNTEAVLVEEMQRMAKRIEELEALLERQTARIVDLQTHIENFEGEDR